MRTRLASLLLVVCSAAALAAPPKKISIDAVLSELADVQEFRNVAISPDGKRVAFTKKIRDRRGAWKLGAVEVAAIGSDAPPRRVSGAADGRAHDEKSPVWSPDGKRIAFLSDAAKDGQSQVWVAPADGGAARRLTSVKGQLEDPRWSPDGRSISFLFVEGSSQEQGALTAYKPDAGVVLETIEEQRIAVVDAATGRLRIVSPANLYVYDYDWSPDGKSFAAEAAEGSGTNNYWIARLYVVAAQSGETRMVWKPPLQIACPRWSPDGREIAVIHGIMSDEGSTGGDIWTVPSAGGEPKNRTPGMKASASALFWRDSGEILFTEYVEGDEGISTLDASGKLARLWRGSSALKYFSAARRGTASAAMRSSFREPYEIFAGPIGEWKAVTKFNAAFQPRWGEAKSIRWESDGAGVQGWL
ncbi:MAG TPA: hypothetical protein VIZ58_11080, partial [Thermoanaerobaculia bacterium]